MRSAMPEKSGQQVWLVERGAENGMPESEPLSV